MKPHATTRWRNEKQGMTEMKYGLVKIGNITSKVSPDAIRKLKFILDQYRICHIVNGVTIFYPHIETGRLEPTRRDRDRKVDMPDHRLRKYKSHHSDYLEFRELIVPDLYKLDYMSLILLDREEEETIGTQRTWFTRME